MQPAKTGTSAHQKPSDTNSGVAEALGHLASTADTKQRKSSRGNG